MGYVQCNSRFGPPGEMVRWTKFPRISPPRIFGPAGPNILAHLVRRTISPCGSNRLLHRLHGPYDELAVGLTRAAGDSGLTTTIPCLVVIFMQLQRKLLPQASYISPNLCCLNQGCNQVHLTRVRPSSDSTNPNSAPIPSPVPGLL